MFLRIFFFFSSRRRHTRLVSDWSSDVCSSDLRLRVQRAQRANCLDSEAGGTGKLLGGGHAAQPVFQERSGAAEPAQVCGSVQWNPNRPPVTGDGRLNCLANPPDGIGDEFDPTVRIELPGRGHEPEVSLADQVNQGNSPVLKLLGHRHDKTHVVTGQTLLGCHIALEGFTGQLHLLFPIEEGDPADLVEVEIETFPAFIDCTGDLRWSYRPTLATCLDCHATSLLRDAGPLLGEQPRLRAEPNLKSANILPKMREINTLGKL